MRLKIVRSRDSAPRPRRARSPRRAELVGVVADVDRGGVSFARGRRNFMCRTYSFEYGQRQQRLPDSRRSSSRIRRRMTLARCGEWRPGAYGRLTAHRGGQDAPYQPDRQARACSAYVDGRVATAGSRAARGAFGARRRAADAPRARQSAPQRTARGSASSRAGQVWERRRLQRGRVSNHSTSSRGGFYDRFAKWTGPTRAFRRWRSGRPTERRS